jgi:hypothetical protein
MYKSYQEYDIPIKDNIFKKYKNLSHYHKIVKDYGYCDNLFVCMIIMILTSPFIFYIGYCLLYHATIHENSGIVMLPNDIILNKTYHSMKFINCAYDTNGKKYYCCRDIYDECDKYQGKQFRLYKNQYYIPDFTPIMKTSDVYICMMLFIAISITFMFFVTKQDFQTYHECYDSIDEIKMMVDKNRGYDYRNYVEYYFVSCDWTTPVLILIFVTVMIININSFIIYGSVNVELNKCMINMNKKDTFINYGETYVNMKIMTTIQNITRIKYSNYRNGIINNVGTINSYCYSDFTEYQIDKPIINFQIYKSIVISFYIIIIILLITKLFVPVSQKEFIDMMDKYIKDNI